MVEAVKGERWEGFRDRIGDRGRDVALLLGRREGGLKLGELGTGGEPEFLARRHEAHEAFCRRRGFAWGRRVGIKFFLDPI